MPLPVALPLREPLELAVPDCDADAEMLGDDVPLGVAERLDVPVFDGDTVEVVLRVTAPLPVALLLRVAVALREPVALGVREPVSDLVAVAVCVIV